MTSPRPARPPASSPDAWFETVHEVTRAALDTVGRVESTFRIGGHLLSVQFAGPRLVPLLTPALDHLRVSPSSDPALTILVWDSRSTGIAMPPPPWPREAYSLRGEVAGFSSRSIRTVFQSDIGALSVIDLDRALAVFWLRDPLELTNGEKAAPFLRILHWWADTKGLALVHAGAVGGGTGAVVLGGPGGSGKSGTTLTCLAHGLQFLGDDYCLLDPGSPPRVHSLYSSAKVHGHDLERLPFLRSLVHDFGTDGLEKAVLFVNRRLPERIARDLPLRALLLPRVTSGSETTLQPAPPAEAVAAIAPSTVGQLPYAGESTVRAIAAVARQAPVYRLNLGSDISTIPGVIASLLP